MFCLVARSCAEQPEARESGDEHDRITAGKLLKILDLAAPVLETDDLEVDVEQEVGFISQFPVASVKIVENEIVVQLVERHTACLALDKCKPAKPSVSEFSPLKFNFQEK